MWCRECYYETIAAASFARLAHLRVLVLRNREEWVHGILDAAAASAIARARPSEDAAGAEDVPGPALKADR